MNSIWISLVNLAKGCWLHQSFLDLPNDAKFLLFQKLLLFGGTCIFFCLRAFFGFGTFWGTWTSHHGADKHLKRRNFPSKKRNFPPKKRKNKSGWQAFPNSQNPKHETALFLEKSKKYPKQQKKVLFQLRAIISHNRKFQVVNLWATVGNRALRSKFQRSTKRVWVLREFRSHETKTRPYFPLQLVV